MVCPPTLNDVALAEDFMIFWGTEKVPPRNCVRKILPNGRVNFLVRFASRPLFYWVLTGNPLELFKKIIWCCSCDFFGFVSPFWPPNFSELQHWKSWLPIDETAVVEESHSLRAPRSQGWCQHEKQPLIRKLWSSYDGRRAIDIRGMTGKPIWWVFAGADYQIHEKYGIIYMPMDIYYEARNDYTNNSETILLCNRCVCNWKINSQRILLCNWRLQKIPHGSAQITQKNSCQKALCNRCPV